MDTVIVTGASGLVGRAICDRLADGGRVVGTCHRLAAAGLRPVDLRQRDQLRALIDEVKPAAVVHAAAYPDPDFCEEHPDEARRLNVDPVRWLREDLPEQVPLVFISSDYVFDGRHAPYAEDDPLCPINVYGRTKVEAEAALAGRPRTVVLRIPLQAGPPPPGGRPGFITLMRAQIERPDPSEVDDVLVRVPTWTGDVAEVVAFLLARRATGIFHASSAQAGTRWHWTQQLADLLGRSIPHLRPSRSILPRSAERPVDAKLNTARLSTLGWDRYTPFAEMVRQLGR